MNIEQIKETLEAVGFTVHGDNLQALIDELHDHYGSQVVGSSMRYLGDAEPLYVKAGQVAFMVDNELDLVSACIRIRSTLKQREIAQPVVMAKEVRSRYIPDISRALEFEIDLASRVNRPVAVVDDQYAVTSDPATRTQTRKSAHMIDDLLADDNGRNQKAVKALQALLIHKR